MNEFELIKTYFQNLSKNNPSSIKLSDDVFFDKKNKLVVSVDTYNEGVHFPNFKFPDLVIKKVLRSSISDLICKGVKPKYYFMSALKLYRKTHPDCVCQRHTDFRFNKYSKGGFMSRHVDNIHHSHGQEYGYPQLSALLFLTALLIACNIFTSSGFGLYLGKL